MVYLALHNNYKRASLARNKLPAFVIVVRVLRLISYIRQKPGSMVNKQGIICRKVKKITIQIF